MPDLYTLRVEGCDDVTYVPLELTPTQMRLVADIARRCTEAGGGCMPTMALVHGHHTWETGYGAEEVTDEWIRVR